MRTIQLVSGLVAAALAIALVSATPARADPKAAAAPARPTPSGPLKAFKGPEGELVVMVEANDGKDMLVHFKNLDKELEGKTLLYRLEDLGNGDKNVYLDKKRGSKTYRSTLVTAREGDWQFYHPIKTSTQFPIRYSEQASGKFKIDDVLSAYKP
jgi:hypothetical protein